jgi:hypothetical protein
MGESIRADFDGDGIHDLVSGSVSESGFTYFITVNVSKSQASSVLTTDIFLSSGFRLVPSDVDMDGDADLVLFRALSLPVAVWANDGRGYFATKPAWDLISGFNTLQPGYSLPLLRTDCTETTDGKRMSAPVSASLLFEGHPSDYQTHVSSRQISRSAHRQPLRGPPALFT